MIPKWFLDDCSEIEKSILYIIVWQTFQPCGYEPSFSCVKLLRKDPLIKILNNLKKQILEEHLSSLENLLKKVTEEL
jgi:hypothetical protein